MKCVCGQEIKKNWKFCPVCGRKLKKFFLKFPSFGNLFKNIEKQFLRMDEVFSSDDWFKFPDLKELKQMRQIPKIKGGGVSVSITNVGGKPTMKVKTFGDFKKIEPGIKKSMGVEEKEVKEIGTKKIKKRKVPKITEEPKSEMKRLGNILHIKINLPKVRSLEDIDIIKLAESIEIRAYAGDKAYFKLLKVPRETKLIGKKFDKNTLEIQLSL